MRFVGFFLLFISLAVTGGVCLGVNGRVPRKFKCAGYESRAH